MTTVEIYSVGIFHCSVCAPKDMPAEEVQKQVNRQLLCGTTTGWTISDEEFFADGETPNGGIVECHRGETRHWLLDA